MHVSPYYSIYSPKHDVKLLAVMWPCIDVCRGVPSLHKHRGQHPSPSDYCLILKYNLMWYIVTRNGGRYSDIVRETEARQELQEMFNKAFEAEKAGLGVWISLWNGDYSHGHYSSVGLINEDLEELYVSYDYGCCYGNYRWKVRIYNPQTYKDIEVLTFEY